MKRCFVCIASLVLLCLVSMFVTSCEMEIEHFTPDVFVKSADCTVWKGGAADEYDTNEKSLSNSELAEGTGNERFNEIVIELDLSTFKGYELTYLDFDIVSTHDVSVTFEASGAFAPEAERTSYGTQTVSLIAGESTSVSLDLNYKVKRTIDEFCFFVTVTTDLPFATESDEEAAEEETTDGEEAEAPLTVGDVEYDISGVLLYGVQTTVT